MVGADGDDGMGPHERVSIRRPDGGCDTQEGPGGGQSGGRGRAVRAGPNLVEVRDRLRVFAAVSKRAAEM
jgi:hypothetical protein